MADLGGGQRAPPEHEVEDVSAPVNIVATPTQNANFGNSQCERRLVFTQNGIPCGSGAKEKPSTEKECTSC